MLSLNYLFTCDNQDYMYFLLRICNLFVIEDLIHVSRNKNEWEKNSCVVENLIQGNWE
jgi:hypothetical protein